MSYFYLEIFGIVTIIQSNLTFFKKNEQESVFHWASDIAW